MRKAALISLLFLASSCERTKQYYYMGTVTKVERWDQHNRIFLPKPIWSITVKSQDGTIHHGYSPTSVEKGEILCEWTENVFDYWESCSGLKERFNGYIVEKKG